MEPVDGYLGIDFNKAFFKNMANAAYWRSVMRNSHGGQRKKKSNLLHVSKARRRKHRKSR